MSRVAGRVLGVDLGDARIGLAVSDPLACIAQPLETVKRVGSKRDLQRVAERAKELDVVAVVVGLPRLLSGEEGEQARKAREFAAGLGRRLPAASVELWDERLTTLQAERTMIDGGVGRRRRKVAVDAMAAALILQGFLDSRHGVGD